MQQPDSHIGCLSCVPLSLGIGNLRKSFGLGESIKCTVVKPGYTYYKSLSSKLVFDVKVKAKILYVNLFAVS